MRGARFVATLTTLAALTLASVSPVDAAPETRLKDVAVLQGTASTPLVGYGLVIGLNKTGDRRQTIFSAQTLANVLERFGVSVGESAAVAKERSPHVEHVNRAVQQWLASLGYQPGRVDGMLGESTVQAIREFEVDKGLVPRGRITADLVRRLSEAAAPKVQGR